MKHDDPWNGSFHDAAVEILEESGCWLTLRELYDCMMGDGFRHISRHPIVCLYSALRSPVGKGIVIRTTDRRPARYGHCSAVPLEQWEMEVEAEMADEKSG